jgi:hypothetical protein
VSFLNPVPFANKNSKRHANPAAACILLIFIWYLQIVCVSAGVAVPLQNGAPAPPGNVFPAATSGGSVPVRALYGYGDSPAISAIITRAEEIFFNAANTSCNRRTSL